MKIRQHSLLLLALILNFSIAFDSIADPPKITGILGTGISNFNLEEKSDSGRLLDRENGTIPSFITGIQLEQSGWLAKVIADYRKNEIKYTAYPNSDSPIESVTDAEILYLEATLSRLFRLNNQFEYSLYAGIGHRNWQREIHSVPEASGLDEEYDWSYLTLGAQTGWELSDTSRLLFDFKVSKVISSSLDVKFLDRNFDPLSLELDNGGGIRLILEWQYRLNESTKLSIGPYLEYWKFDKSHSAPLTLNGVPQGSLIHEPEHTTRIFGLNALLYRSF